MHSERSLTIVRKPERHMHDAHCQVAGTRLGQEGDR